MAAYTAAEGAPLEIDTIGVFDLPKAAGQALVVGDKAYFDAGAKTITGAASGNKLVGSILLPAGATDAAAQVRLSSAVVA